MCHISTFPWHSLIVIPSVVERICRGSKTKSHMAVSPWASTLAWTCLMRPDRNYVPYFNFSLAQLDRDTQRSRAHLQRVENKIAYGSFSLGSLGFHASVDLSYATRP
eukprot:TRINITY_DN26374_c0_g1_i1.p1 TRINITY_DN26374_c0_g1~~TRINITY_DN26374_c0_g1_i1.p1  ORF type:complete len:107 (-),score=2.09 TRINITY_DN26374_c0_g1_i1:94-414(-)